MRPRNTLFLFLLVAALGTFVYLWERHQQNTLERRAAINLTELDETNVDGMVNVIDVNTKQVVQKIPVPSCHGIVSVGIP